MSPPALFSDNVISGKARGTDEGSLSDGESSARPRGLYDIITGNEIPVGGAKREELIGNAETRPRCAEMMDAARA